jgi:hypothetical protein
MAGSSPSSFGKRSIRLNSDLTNLVKTGVFIVNCASTGENVFYRDNISDAPSYPFSNCIFEIVNYQATPRVSTLTINGSNSFLVDAKTTGNHYIRWWYFKQ